MLSPTISRRKIFWRFQIGGWLLLIPPFAALGLFASSTLSAALCLAIFRQVEGFVLTLGLARIYCRWHWNTFSLRHHGTLVLLLCLLATAIDLVLTHLLRGTVQLNFGAIPPDALQLAASIGRICVYAGWSVVYLVFHFFFELRERDLRLAEAEIAARDAELHVLRAQLNPHFLFNALNSILAEADDNPARVKAITLNLSELLRFSLRQRDHFGPLGAELAAVENYLKVERSRFEERLQWRIEASPVVREAVVPTSLLLPLVENAIKYGLQTCPGRLDVTVSVGLRDGVLCASVENSGHWLEPDPTAMRSTGIGLPNLRRRLVLLCGPAAEVDISFPPGFVRVALRVPVSAPALA